MPFSSTPVEGQANNHDASFSGVTACPNCQTAMPSQMRFCRMCGYRLGEGVAEYAETVRLQQPAAGAGRPFQTEQREDNPKASAQPGTMHGSFRDQNETLARDASARGLAQGGVGPGRLRRSRRRVWPHWFIWPIIGIALSVSATGGNWIRHLTSHAAQVRVRPNVEIPPITVISEDSSLGTSDLESVAGGASFDSVTPGSAADQAGLVGGDIINSFDGKPVKDADELSDQLEHTPVGKTVEIVFTRDGKSLTARLRTLSEDENERGAEQLEERREGKGFIGEGTDLDRVPVPGMNIEGVRLGEIRKNNPAAIAGLRDGDIVIEFNDIPIRTRAEFESRIQRTLPGSIVKTVIVRGSERLEIPVKVGQED